MIIEIIKIITPAMIIMYIFYRYIDKKTEKSINKFHKEREKLEKQKDEIINKQLNNIIIEETKTPIKKLKKHVTKNENKEKIINTTTKKSFYDLKQEWIQKGKEYEQLVGNYYERLGYIVKFNGIEKGKKDNSIDLIAIKNNEITFIQCKNWKEDSKYKISQKDIKSFIGDTHTFISNNPQYKNYIIKREFIISNKILNKAAYAYIKSNNHIIDYKLIKFN